MSIEQLQVNNEQAPPYNTVSKEALEHDNSIINQALSILNRRMLRTENLLISKPQDVKNYLKLKIANKEHEVFSVMFLDTRHKLIAYEEMFRGTIDEASVYPREVVKKALEHNAAAIVLAHNHPSGDSTPSQADEKITFRLCVACKLMGIQVIDHLIIGESITSLAEKGVLP